MLHKAEKLRKSVLRSVRLLVGRVTVMTSATAAQSGCTLLAQERRSCFQQWGRAEIRAQINWPSFDVFSG